MQGRERHNECQLKGDREHQRKPPEGALDDRLASLQHMAATSMLRRSFFLGSLTSEAPPALGRRPDAGSRMAYLL